jgi:hypothetical protein
MNAHLQGVRDEQNLPVMVEGIDAVGDVEGVFASAVDVGPKIGPIDKCLARHVSCDERGTRRLRSKVDRMGQFRIGVKTTPEAQRIAQCMRGVTFILRRSRLGNCITSLQDHGVWPTYPRNRHDNTLALEKLEQTVLKDGGRQAEIRDQRSEFLG